MKKTTAVTSALLAITLVAGLAGGAQRLRDRVPDLSGAWYMDGDRNKPCEIRQRRGDNRALFINENGDEAWGTIRGNTVSIPDWTDGERQGLRGTIRRNRIVWPNGSFWSR